MSGRKDGTFAGERCLGQVTTGAMTTRCTAIIGPYSKTGYCIRCNAARREFSRFVPKDLRR